MLNDAFDSYSLPEHSESGQCSSERCPGRFDRLFSETEQELYPGCKNFTSFQFIVKLMHVKFLIVGATNHLICCFNF